VSEPFHEQKLSAKQSNQDCRGINATQRYFPAFILVLLLIETPRANNE